MIKTIFLIVAPGIMAGWYYKKLIGEQWDIFRHIEVYAFFSYFIYFACNVVLVARGHGLSCINLEEQNVITTCKYIAITLALIVILPHLAKVLKRFKDGQNNV